MKKTKIICTLGPASNNEDTLTKLIENGMNVSRHNFSHGDHDFHRETMNLVRKVSKKLDKYTGILLDTKGPEIRTHLFADKLVEVVEGTEVTVCINEVKGTATKFSINYPGLIDDVEVGGQILVDDGYLTLQILKIDKNKGEILTKALNTHTIKDRRGVNVPNTVLNMPFISDKDKSDIIFGAKENVDFIAASFVRRADDVNEIRKILKDNGNTRTQIISKIENQEGVDNIDEIIEVSDGIMVARGDLGVEVPFEEVPFIQKEIIAKCQANKKIVVTATQMLESMQQNPRPTRAEVSDVANAILDGTDAIMLSGESAAGKYPVESVKTMNEIAMRTENDLDYCGLGLRAIESIDEDSTTSAIALSAKSITLELGLNAIICPTASGFTARSISKFRPNTPILAITGNEDNARSLALNFGVEARVQQASKTMDTLLENSIKLAKEHLKLNKNDRVLISAGLPIGTTGSTNTIKIADIKE